MFQVRRSHERGHANHGWLDTYHTFSFGGYQDPEHLQFRSLRVMNEDVVAPSQGFGTHPHRNDSRLKNGTTSSAWLLRAMPPTVRC